MMKWDEVPSDEREKHVRGVIGGEGDGERWDGVKLGKLLGTVWCYVLGNRLHDAAYRGAGAPELHHEGLWRFRIAQAGAVGRSGGGLANTSNAPLLGTASIWCDNPAFAVPSSGTRCDAIALVNAAAAVPT